MAPIVTSIEVDRCADEVLGYAMDPTRFQEWQQDVVDGRMEKHGIAEVGARCVMTRRIGGANRPSIAEAARYIWQRTGRSPTVDVTVAAASSRTKSAAEVRRRRPGRCSTSIKNGSDG